MKTYLAAGAMCATLLTSTAQADGVQVTTESYGPFGTMHLYRTSDHPSNVVLFISGDGGWNLGVVNMATSLAELDSLVVGIDITHYVGQLDKSAETCAYAAAQFESMSQYLQKKHGFAKYIPPVLVGYSSGAAMVYSTLAQSPPNTFAGGISLGFCPDLKTVHPFCKGNGALTYTKDPNLGFVYDPVERLPAPLAILQGDQDQVCDTPATKEFASKVGGAEVIELPAVGHGFSVQKNWLPQFKEAFQKIAGRQQRGSATLPASPSVSDLPLVELPVREGSKTMAVVISGDGGWASLDKQIGETLNADGLPVVGWNSLQYFWEKKSPETLGTDMARVLTNYSERWGADKFVLVGYSLGADSLPFMVSRLPDKLRSKVSAVALLGLAPDVDFEFHVSNWLTSGNKGEYEVIPEVQKLKGMNIVCIYGSDEADSACKSFAATDVKVIELPGGHHFGGDYQKLASIILGHSKTN